MTPSPSYDEGTSPSRTPRRGRKLSCSAPVAAQVLLVLPHQEVRAEIGDLGGAHLGQAEVDLTAEDAQRLGRTGDTARRHAVERRPALKDELGAHADGDQRVEP